MTKKQTPTLPQSGGSYVRSGSELTQTTKPTEVPSVAERRKAAEKPAKKENSK